VTLSAVLGIVAAVAAAAFVIMVVTAGGWRAEPRPDPDTAPAPGPMTPQQQAFALRWRAVWVTEVIRISLLVLVGLTPAGAHFVHALAPSGNWLLEALAWGILVAVFGAASLVGRGWRRRAKALIPGLYPPRIATARNWRREIAARAQNVLALVLIAYSLRAGRGDFAIGLTLAIPVGALATMRQRRLRRLPPSPHLTAVLAALKSPPRRRAPVAVVGWRGRNFLANALAVDGLMPHPLILVAPPLVTRLEARQLRAVLAHELAHVLHRDSWRRLVRVILMSEAALATAIALTGLDPAQDMAGLPARLDGRAVPFLVAIWYLMLRLLAVANLRATRAEEQAADARAVSLTDDPAGCAEGLNELGAILGSPERWTFGQRLLVATHPARAVRSQWFAQLPLASLPGAHSG